jgi:transcriptional regulator with XRE-family HTH domain
MTIGEKIKMLRTSKLMTQSELAGSEITRNMLSRIENGAAQPSLDTLRYLADKLNVSAGYLLSEGTAEQIYLKHNEMQGIKTAYLMGDHRICRDMCLNSASADDDEIKLILAECTLEVAIEEFNRGNLRSACECFDEAIEACSATIYNTGHILSISSVYFRYMRTISATLSSNMIDENEIPVWQSLSDAFCLYAVEFMSLSEENTTATATAKEGSIYALHIEAIRCIRQEYYSRAYELLHRILVSDESLPEPVMYNVFCDLEVACKQTGDFKGAYEYSINKMEVLQKLLS